MVAIDAVLERRPEAQRPHRTGRNGD